MTKKLLALSVAALLTTGCSTTIIKWPERGNSPEGIYSRQVAFMPYTTQGVDVMPVNNWYYGQTQGVKAYAVEGGVVYVDDSGSSPKDKKHSKKNRPERHSSDAHSHSMDDHAGHGNDVGSGASGAGSAIANSNGSGLSQNANSAMDKSLSVQKMTDDAALNNTAAADGTVKSDRDTKQQKNKADYFDQRLIVGDLALVVNFPLNKSDKLYAESEENLVEFIKGFMPENKRLILIGYTDDIGLDDYNIPFSEKRANFIKKRFTKIFPELKVSAIGSGPSPRLTDNRIEDGRKNNRRVEIFIVKEEK